MGVWEKVSIYIFIINHDTNLKWLFDILYMCMYIYILTYERTYVYIYIYTCTTSALYIYSYVGPLKER